MLLGVVGAVLGGFASYVELQSILERRAHHNRFEQLAASEVVKEERKTLQTPVETPKSDYDIGFVPNPDYVPNPSKVNKGGIETINWSKGYMVLSIETDDGGTLYSTAAPAAWEYLLVVLFPILGFLIPWGAVRAIAWVGAGFNSMENR